MVSNTEATLSAAAGVSFWTAAENSEKNPLFASTRLRLFQLSGMYGRTSTRAMTSTAVKSSASLIEECEAFVRKVRIVRTILILQT